MSRLISPVVRKAAEQDLEQRILAFLASRGSTALRYVSVRADGDTILLTGVVATYYVKQLAQEYARRVVGVRRVVNQIAVGTVIDSEGPFDPATDILLGR
jgi:osmotically-inducible protein OsmY